MSNRVQLYQMQEFKSPSKEKEKSTDQYSTSNSMDYAGYLQNIKYNLEQNLQNYNIDILLTQNPLDQQTQNDLPIFSLVVTSNNVYSNRLQLFTQSFINQQTFSFKVKHILLLNNKQLIIHHKPSILVALKFLNKINQFLNNIQLVIDPVSGKIYFQTKSFIIENSFNYLRKCNSLKLDCFYTQVLLDSIRKAQRYVDLVLYLIGELSLTQLLINPSIRKQFTFLTQSLQLLSTIEKNLWCLNLLGKKQISTIQRQNQQQKQPPFQQPSDYSIQNLQQTQPNRPTQLVKQPNPQQLLQKQLFHTLQYFTPNLQSTLSIFTSKPPHSNISLPTSLNLLQKNNPTLNLNFLQFDDRISKTSAIISSKKSQSNQKILTVIEIIGLQGKNQYQQGQWTLLSQGGFGIVQIAIVCFKNLSTSFQFQSPTFTHQQLVRKRDKISTKSKISRQRRILQLLQPFAHSNITNHYISFQSEYDDAIFSDYTPHMSLDLYVKKNTLSVSFYHKLQFLIQAIDGLIFLHQKGILHLDIKPGNMLVHRSLRVKLSDFGQAFVIEEDNMKTHQHAYTVPYCAPEIFPPIMQLTQSVDVYAIGVCLLRLVMSESYLDTFLKKKFVQRLCQNKIDSFVIGQKFQNSFLSPIFKIIQYVGLLAVNQESQKRPQLKWINQILEMCKDFILDLIY